MNKNLGEKELFIGNSPILWIISKAVSLFPALKDAINTLTQELDELPPPSSFFPAFASHLNSLSPGEIAEKLNAMGEFISQALVAFPVEIGLSFQYDFYERLDPLRQIQVSRAITNEAKVALDQVLD